MTVGVDRDLQPGPVEDDRAPRRLPGWVDPTTGVFVVLSLVFGIFFALAVPAGWGPDESAQFDRAFQVASGGFAPLRLPDADGLPVYGGAVPGSAVHVATFAGPPSQLGRQADQWRPLFHPGPGYAAALAEPLNSDRVVVWFPNTAAYSPVPYLPAAVGVKVAELLDLSIGHAWTLMRLVQVLAYTLVAAAGLFALRTSRFRWAALAIALLPTAIYQTGVVSADAVTNAVAFTFLALVTKAVVLTPRTQRVALNRWEYSLLLLCAVALPLMKPTYFILSLLVLAVPTRLGRAATSELRSQWWRFLPAAGATVLSIAGVAWWSALSAGTTQGMGWMRGPSERHLVQPDHQLAFVVGHPLDVLGIGVRTLAMDDWSYLTSFFGQMGYALGSNLVTPVVGAVCTTVALVLGLRYAAPGHAGRARTLWLALVWLVSFAAIFGTLYLAFTPLHASFVTGVQGRYFVPLGLLGVAVAMQVMPGRPDPGSRTLRRTEALVFVLCAAALVVAASKYALMIYIPGYHA